MGLARADYELLYSTATTIEFQESPGLLGLCNTTYLEQARQGRGHEVIVRDVLYGNVGANDTVIGRGNMAQTWGDANSLGLAQISLAVDRSLRSNPVSLLDYDENGMSIDLEGTARMRLSNALQVTISREIAAYWASLATFATYFPGPDDVPKDDGSGANGNAGKIFDAGVIGPSAAAAGLKGDRSEATFGRPQGNVAAQNDLGEAIDEFLRYQALRLKHIYVANGEQIGPAPGSIWCVADPAVWDAYALWLDRRDIGYDPIAQGFEGPSVATPGRMRHGLMLIELPTPSLQPGQADDAAKAAGFPVYLGSNMACAAAVEPFRTAMEMATERVDADDKVGESLMGQWTYWGRGLVNAPLLIKGAVKSVA